MTQSKKLKLVAAFRCEGTVGKRRCACGGKVRVYDFGDGEMEVDGVLLKPEGVSKLIDALIGSKWKKK